MRRGRRRGHARGARADERAGALAAPGRARRHRAERHAPRRAQEPLAGALRALPAEYLVIDVGPGHAISRSTSCSPPTSRSRDRPRAAGDRDDLPLRARRVSPAPARTVARDRLRSAILDRALAEIGVLPPPLELVRKLAKTDKTLAELAWAEAQAMRVQLVVNQTRVRTDLELGAWMSGLVSRHYGVALDELGHIEHDDTVWLTVRRNKPLLVDSPASKSARNIERIARRVLALATSKTERHAAVAAPARGADALRGARRDALGERRGDPPRLQAPARDLRDGRPRHGVAPRRSASSPRPSASSTRRTTRCSIPCAAAPTTSRRSPSRSRRRSRLARRGPRSPPSSSCSRRSCARDRPRHRVHRRAPPQGARVARARARRDQREDEDRARAPAGARGGALRRSAGARLRARLRRRAREVPTPRPGAGPEDVPAPDARGDGSAGQGDRVSASASSARARRVFGALLFVLALVPRALRRRSRGRASRCGTGTTTTSARDASPRGSATRTTASSPAGSSGTRGATTRSATARSSRSSTASSARTTPSPPSPTRFTGASLAVVTWALARYALSPWRARGGGAHRRASSGAHPLRGARDDRAARRAADARRVLGRRARPPAARGASSPAR